MIKLIGVVLLVSLFFIQIDGHGMMLSPAGRSSRWRYDSSAKTNYDDNALYCGGFWKQTANGGLCGMCGDDYSLAQPRPNEHGGTYGDGVIVEKYTSSGTASVTVRITANHLGYFTFQLCNVDANGSETEKCFESLNFADGSDKYYIGTTTGNINMELALPTGVSCEHCVLRWKYTAGNNWGVCEDGTGALGCGDQETFMSCADVSISAAKDLSISVLDEIPVEVEDTF